MTTVQYLFTDRKGGVSAPPFSSFNLGRHVGDDPDQVAENRRRLGAAVAGRPVVFMDQVHSATVAVVTDPAAGFPATDGMVTRLADVALAVMVADCVPILMYDQRGGVIGVAHAGRPGAAAGIGEILLRTMIDEGADPATTTAVLGPAVCGPCYEVPEAMRTEVEGRLPGSACRTRQGTAGLDLRAGLARQLRRLGVAEVVIDPRCTREDDTLFSHRRQAPTGRQAGVIWQTDRLGSTPAGGSA